MKSNYTKLKNKALFYIFLIGVVMSFFVLILAYQNYHQKMENQFEKKSSELHAIIKNQEKRIVKLYQSRLIKNLKSLGVKDAIKNQDNQELYKFIVPRYEELKKSNINFKMMHFHNKDNTSFLRMHKPNKFGDDLSSFRQIVVDTNNLKRPFYGFEKGKYGYFYRIINPIVYENVHYGSVEFGLGLEYFIANLKNIVPNVNFGLMIKRNETNDKEFKSIKDHSLIVDYDNFFTTFIETIDIDKKFQILDKDDKTYIISSNIYIKDYKGKDAIKILFAIDITDYKNETINEFLFMMLIGGLTYILSFLIINAAFEKYIKSIETQSKQLEENAKVIDQFVIMSSTDTKGIITHTSSAFEQISGYSKKELVSNPHNMIRDPQMDKNIFKNMWNTIQQGKLWTGEIQNLKKDGSSYWVNAFISPNFNDNLEITGFTAVRQDITDKKIIEKISQTDKLTQINNRVKLDDVLDMELARSNRYKNSFSVILLDIDKFKSVNDTYGHQVGDTVLVQTAQLLSKHLRKTDTLGRWGGEEFMIICSQTDEKGALNLAEALRSAMEKFEFDIVKNKTASFGVSEYKIGEDIDELLKRCDDALYQSKENGRNKVTSF